MFALQAKQLSPLKHDNWEIGLELSITSQKKVSSGLSQLTRELTYWWAEQIRWIKNYQQKVELLLEEARDN